MKLIRTLLLSLGLVLLPGCPSWIAKFLPIVAEVIAIAGEAGDTLDVIDSAGEAALAAHPDPDVARQFRGAMARARAAVAAMHRAASGTENLNRQDLEAAFADYRIAFAELQNLLGPLGLSPGDPGMLRAAPDVEPIELVEPRALTYELPPEL